MPDFTEKTTRNRQKNAVSGCDLDAERSQPRAAKIKNGCDLTESTANKSIEPSESTRIEGKSLALGSQPCGILITAKRAAEIIQISGQAVRDNAAAGKYPGAFKAKTNGGEGWLIPLDTLPGEAQARYWHEQITASGLTRGMDESASSFTPEEREEHWKRYELATEKCQTRAKHAFAALALFNDLVRKGSKKMDAYAAVTKEFNIARSTFNEWQKAVDGLTQGDWPPALVPDFSGKTNAPRVEWPGSSWLFFLNDALTPARPLAIAYRRTKREAAAQGWGELPSLQTARRNFGNLPDDVKTYYREGDTALKRLSPTVQRDYSAFALHEQWSMDGRRMDLIVRDTKGEFGPKGKIFRLWLYALMDMRSRYIVGYSIGRALNGDAVRAAVINAFTNTGRIVPQSVQIDNGMEAAAKEISGGAPWRRRGKVKEDETIGLFPLLGIEIPWALPGHGQTKPIERGFLTLAMECETRPEFKGAYCGSNPEVRPEEWDMEKAVPVDLVRKIFRETVETYHRNPHRGDSMDGKSPLQVYEELMSAPGFTPRQISERQFRVCMLSAVPVTIRKDGSFAIYSGRYKSEETARAPKGSGYTARYNPDDLAQPVFLYRGNKLIAENVPQIERTPGNNKEAAKNIMKARADYTKAVKASAKALTDIQAIDTPAEIAKRLAEKHPEMVDKEAGEVLPVAKVVTLVKPAAELPRESTPAEADEAARIKAMVEEMSRMTARPVRRVGK